MSYDFKGPEGLVTLADVTANGLRGYKRLHEELAREKDLLKTDPNELERRILHFVAMTNHVEYIASMKRFLDRFKAVIVPMRIALPAFQKVLNEFAHYKESLGDLLAFRDLYAKREAQYASEQAFSSEVEKIIREARSDKIKRAIKRASGAEEARAWEERWSQIKAFYDEMKSRRFAVTYYGGQNLPLLQALKGKKPKKQQQQQPGAAKGNFAEKQREFLEEYNKRHGNDVQRMLDAAVDALESKLKTVPGVAAVSETPQQVRDEAARRIPKDPTIRDFLEWRSSPDRPFDAVEGGEDTNLENLRIDDSIANAASAVRVAHLYKSGDDPLTGFRKFLESVQSVLLDAAKRSDKDKSLPGTVVKEAVHHLDAYLNNVNNTPEDDVARDPAVGRSLLNKISDLITRFQGIVDAQTRVLANAGKRPVFAQADPAKLEAALRGKSAAGSGEGSGAVSGSGSSGTGFLPSAAGQAYAGGKKYTDEMRAQDVARARDAPRLLMRKIDMDAVRAYTDQLRRFRNKVREANTLGALQSMVLARADAALRRANEAIANVDANVDGTSGDDEATKRQRRARIGASKKKHLKSLMDGLRARFAEFAQMHLDFVLRDHRDGFRYMQYWRNVVVDTEEAKKALDAYFEDLAALAEETDKRFVEMRQAYRDALQGDAPDAYPGLAKWSVGIPAHDHEELMARLSDVDEELEDRRQKVQRLYGGGGVSWADVLFARKFVFMYALKGLRVLYAWAALHFAERVFQTWYAKRVYARSEEPPHPVQMIGIFIGVEFAFVVVTLAVLLLVRALFDTPAGRFPVDDAFLGAFALDYLLTTATLVVLSAVIAQVVRRKKYFHYRYEGDRGIRALRSMVFYTAVIVLLVPFFRLTGGNV